MADFVLICSQTPHNRSKFHLLYYDRVGYEQAVAATRVQLGEEAFAAAWQKGWMINLEQVIDDALKRGDESGKQ